MKLNRRSFIQKTLAMLATLAAGLRGDGVAPIGVEAPFLVGIPAQKSARPLGIPVTLGNPSITRLPDQWGTWIEPNGMLHIKDEWREMSVDERKQFYMDAVLEQGEQSEEREFPDTLLGCPIEWINVPMDNYKKVTVIIT